jgi:uncharacterized membrane protein YgcG
MGTQMVEQVNADIQTDAPPPTTQQAAVQATTLGDAEMQAMWTDDSKSPNVLIALVRRIGNSSQMTREASWGYLRFVNTQLPTIPINLTSVVTSETRRMWLACFTDPSNDWQTLRELNDVWLGVVNRMLSGWANSKDKTVQHMFHTMLTEMLEYASAFMQGARQSSPGNSDKVPDDEGVGRSHDDVHYRIMVDRYKSMRDGVVKLMKTLESKGPQARARWLAVRRIWNTMGSDHRDDMKKQGCFKGDANMSMCRIAYKTRLRMMRQHMESALSFHDIVDGIRTKQTFKLHPLMTHLFDVFTYRRLKEPISEFIELTEINDGNKFVRMRMLQKMFEREALIEINQRFLEMWDDIAFITGELKARTAPSSAKRQQIMACCENMEWACTRTWQDDFTPPDVAMEQAKAPPTLAPMSGGGLSGGGSSEGGGSPGEGGLYGGDGADEADGTTESANLVLAAVNRDIIRERNRVRRAFYMIRGGMRGLLTAGAPHMGSLAVFLQDSVMPRISAVLDSVERNVKAYLDIDLQLDDDTTLERAERSQVAQNIRMSTLKQTDILAYKLADTTVPLMYALKALRLVGQCAALYLSQKVFSERYMRVVHGSVDDDSAFMDGKETVGGRDPPHITKMLLMFLSIDATLQLIVLVILVLLSYLKKSHANTYIIDDVFLSTFLMEYFISTVAVAVLGLLFARLMRKKMYFMYPMQGSSVGRAYRDIMLGTCAAACAVPFFLLF